MRPHHGLRKRSRHSLVRVLLLPSLLLVGWSASATASESVTHELSRGTRGTYTLEIQVGTPPQTFDVVVDTGEDVTDEAYAAMLESIPALQTPVKALLADEDPGDAESPAMIASAVELVLEGLHLSKRLNKDGGSGKAQFRSRS